MKSGDYTLVMILTSDIICIVVVCKPTAVDLKSTQLKDAGM